MGVASARSDCPRNPAHPRTFCGFLTPNPMNTPLVPPCARRMAAMLFVTATTLVTSVTAQTTAPAAAPQNEDVLVLSPFEVSADDSRGYQATQTLAGTRIRTDLKDVGSAITVITKEFMQDIG